jgi:hypothetical protein
LTIAFPDTLTLRGVRLHQLALRATEILPQLFREAGKGGGTSVMGWPRAAEQIKLERLCRKPRTCG